MGLRTGIDLTPLSRIESVLDRFGERFHHKYFGDLNEEYGDYPPETYAGLWAVKEATFKVMGRGYRWNAVTVQHRKSGRPELSVNYEAASLADTPIPRSAEWDCSISHDGDLAVAVAVCIW